MSFHRGDIVAGMAKGTIYRLTRLVGDAEYQAAYQTSGQWECRVVTPGTDSMYEVGDRATCNEDRITLVQSFDAVDILDDEEDLS